MKKNVVLFLFLITFTPFGYAYTYTMTDAAGNILVDRKCEANGSYFNCIDNLTGNGFNEPRHQRKVKKVYVNGKYKSVTIDTYGNETSIKY